MTISQYILWHMHVHGACNGHETADSHMMWSWDLTASEAGKVS